MSAGLSAGNPYIGLRYFDESDAHLFYGRDEHVAELLGKLAVNRFVAVLGSSGSGKSSLVRAGLLPELRSGMIPKAGPRWKVVEFQPGRAPLGALSASIRSVLGIDTAYELVAEGPLGIVRAVAAAGLEADTNVLIIADQFEEVFRFQREEASRDGDHRLGTAAAEECKALARRLMDAAMQAEQRIYVLLVMRSDYLGDCAQFPDLPETMSRSLYVVPRLRRDQLQEAITAPVGGRIEAAVVQRLLAEAGSDPDQLPRLQHLLARMWDGAKGGPLTMENYRAAGGWAMGLERHLEEVYAGLSDGEAKACRPMFQSLSELDAGRAVRRRAEVAELIEVCGPAVSDVVGKFRKAAFLRAVDDPVDITHESILREWARLRQWMVEEDRNAKRLREVADAAKDAGWQLGLDAEKEKAVSGIAGLTLHNLVAWRKEAAPNASWARRYRTAVDFETALSYLTWSETREVRAKRRQKISSRLMWGLGVALVLVLTAASWQFYELAREGKERELAARKFAQLASDAQRRADAATAGALAARAEADARVSEAEAALARTRGKTSEAATLSARATKFRETAQTLNTAAVQNAIAYSGAAPDNFVSGRRGFQPEAIVIHVAGGTLKAVVATFQQSSTHASAHYVVGRDGQVLQFVQEVDTAFHVGRVDRPTWTGLKRVEEQLVNPNFYTIGIEHEGQLDDKWTEQMYSASAALIAQIAQRWKFPIDRQHVVGHHEILFAKTCPGSGVDMERLVRMAQERAALVGH